MSSAPRDADPAREPLIATNDRNRVKKEDSMRRKLRTYEIFLAIKDGYMPTTDQLVGWARYALRNGGVLDSRSRRLSPPGRAFLRDLRAWTEAVVDLGMSKNLDDKIQEFIYHTSHATVSGQVPKIDARTPRSNSDVQKAYDRLRQLGTLVYSSSEFRRLLSEFAELGRDVFADAASQVAITASGAADSARQTDVDPDAMSSKVLKEKGSQYLEKSRRSAYQSRDDMESYLRQKFPKQRRDALVNRLKAVVSDIQQNPEFSETVDFMLELAREYVNRIQQQLTEESRKSAASVSTDDHFDVALQDARAIIMVFAGGKDIDTINDRVRQVVEDIQKDPELSEFYEHVTNEFKRLLTEKDYVKSDAADDSAHRLYERSQELLNEKSEKYRPDVESLFDEIRSFVDAMTKDPENRRVIDSSKKVFNDLVSMDRNGIFRGFKKRVLRDLLDVVFPRFIDEIRYVPLPRIEYQSRDYDLILENVVLESEHFLPYKTIFEAFSRAEFTNDYQFNSKYTTTTRLHIDNINLFAKDTSFVLRKKTGLFQFSDRGFVDIFMDGRGASADIILDSTSNDTDEDEDTMESYFHVRSVKVNVNHFSYNYHAYHSWAAALLSPFIRPAVRSMLSNMLESKIKSLLETADREIHAMFERMRVASLAQKGGGSLESYIRAVMSRPKGRRTGGRSGNRVSVGMDEELFPGEHGPGAVMSKVRRAQENVERAGEDGGWRNQIFDP